MVASLVIVYRRRFVGVFDRFMSCGFTEVLFDTVLYADTYSMYVTVMFYGTGCAHCSRPQYLQLWCYSPLFCSCYHCRWVWAQHSIVLWYRLRYILLWVPSNTLRCTIACSFVGLLSFGVMLFEQLLSVVIIRACLDVQLSCCAVI